MNFYLISLGCAKNLVDSEKLTNELEKKGYFLTDDINKSELIIINTCGFIKSAKEESVDTILSVISDKPKKAKVIVYGCLVQRYKEELEKTIPEISAFFPILPYEKLAEEISKICPVKKVGKEERKKILFTPPSYTYVKIAEGCRNFCSYCAIPLIRGSLKSFPREIILREIEDRLDSGYKEINLIAQDITSYGIDLYKKPSLSKLISEILKIKKDFWLRLLYLFPTRIDDDLIEIIKSDSRIVKYLDIPIQHINDRILKLMNRDYTKKDILKTIDKLREKVDGITLRSSFIVGFPTETEKDFEELVDFIRTKELDHIGVFDYSKEEDTPAFKLKPMVTSQIKKKRKRVLMNIQKDIEIKKNKEKKGKIYKCIIDKPADDFGAVYEGRIYSQAPEVDGITYVRNYDIKKGLFVDVKIKTFRQYDLIADCL
ncbi:MAG: 30S ribosomal protein S12 methylthiotransferase RimO [Proteobacteria bacterium]|nr:30S ribosomal protein S12 methylthiotransferase RimO [Pseudomonadota bacterium]